MCPLTAQCLIHCHCHCCLQYEGEQCVAVCLYECDGFLEMFQCCPSEEERFYSQIKQMVQSLKTTIHPQSEQKTSVFEYLFLPLQLHDEQNNIS